MNADTRNEEKMNYLNNSRAIIKVLTMQRECLLVACGI